MSFPEVVTREEWLAARQQLLVAEKRHTRERDELNATRRRLPMVRVEKEYAFEGPKGTVTLSDLFEGHTQLIVQHVMFGPDWERACPGCTAAIDEIAPGLLTHLRSRDTSFALVSRAPLAKLDAYQVERGWTVPWYSSHGSDFNYDYGVSFDSSSPAVYNYRAEPELSEPQRERSPELHRLTLRPATGARLRGGGPAGQSTNTQSDQLVSGGGRPSASLMYLTCTSTAASAPLWRLSNETSSARVAARD